VKDLKEEGILSISQSKVYNFEDLTVSQSAALTLPVQGVMVDEVRNGKKTKTFITQTEILEHANAFDRLTVNGVEYKIIPPITNNGYITTIRVN
jgi:hypothetical protein